MKPLGVSVACFGRGLFGFSNMTKLDFEQIQGWPAADSPAGEVKSHCSPTSCSCIDHRVGGCLRPAVVRIMPGGLASWLDDDNKTNSINKCNSNSRSNRGNTATNALNTRALPASAQARPNRQPLTTEKEARPHEISIIDVDTDNSSSNDEENSGVLSSSATPSDTKQNKPRPWNPFAGNSAGDDKRPDAFARLRQGPALSAAAHSPPSTPARKTIDQRMAWDPFPDSGGDGKENRENAFSRMLASGSSSGKGQHGPSGGKKRKRPVAGSWSSNNGDVKAGVAAARFCECPVCGKTVSLIWPLLFFSAMF